MAEELHHTGLAALPHHNNQIHHTKGEKMGNIARFCVLKNRNKFYLYDWKMIEIYEIGEAMYELLLHIENMEKSEFINKVLESNIEYKEDIIDLINEDRLFYDSEEKFADQIEYPSCINIMCGVGHNCNLDCQYCFLKDRKGNKEQIDDTNVVLNILPIINHVYNNYNEIRVAITDGGEPFLFRDRIIDLLTEIDKIDIDRKVKITVVTNGTIYDEEILNILSEHDATIVFSLEGHLDNNKIRKSKNKIDNYTLCANNYAKYQEVLKSKITKNIWASSIVNAETGSIVSTLIDSYNLGFRTIQLRIIKGMKNGVGVNNLNLNRFFELYDELFDFFIKNIDDNEDKYLKAILNNGDFVGQLFVPLLLGRAKVKHCLGAFSTISIDSDGKIYPCTYLNGESNSEIHIFCNEDKVVKQYQELHIDSIEKCSRCWASTACGGHCPYQSIQYGKIFNEPDESVCELTQHVLQNIIYLIDYLEGNNPTMYTNIYNFAKKRTYLYDLLR